MKMATYTDWANYMQNGIVPPLRGRILESWERCIKNLSPESTDFKYQETQSSFSDELMKGIRFCKDTVLKGTTCTRIAWMLCGPDGEVLEISCDSPHMNELLDRIGIREGFQFDEQVAGTNAVGLAKFYKGPFFLSGCEHFLRAFHQIAAAAAPIYELDGSLRGFITIWGSLPESDPWLLRGIILAFIHLLDLGIRLERSSNLHNSLRKQLSAQFNDDLTPRLMVTRNGYIRQLNPAAAKFFELDEKISKEKNLDKLAVFSPTVKEIVNNAIPVSGKPVKIRLASKKIEAEYDKEPLFSDRDEFQGCFIAFHVKNRHSQVTETKKSEARYRFEDIIGHSPPLRKAIALARRAADTSVNVLIHSPSGTGKEVFAHSIHAASERKDQPFVAINCAAIPREIAESELFGYAPGAFTGARRSGQVGKLEAADGGTVFLDEIGDMPMELQAKLLRMLEDHSITRVGDREEIPVDIRIIAATNKNIPELIEKDLFREDLYYRLNVTSITLPTLQEDKDDIPELVSSFIEMFNERMGKKVKGIIPEIMSAFKNYSWPGNVRELKNAIEFAVMLNTGEDDIAWKDLPGHLRATLLYREPQENTGNGSGADPFRSERQMLENSERALYIKAIKMSGGNMSHAAGILGVGRSTLYRKLKKFGLK